MNELNELHDLSAAYALDALDPAERTEFEEHLAGCEQCRRDVDGFRGAAAELAGLAEAPAPPPSLRAAVLAAVTDVEQLPPVTGRARRALEPLDDEPEAVVTPAAEPAEPAVDELALRRANRRTRLLSVLVAAVTVVALALGGTVYSLARQDQPPTAGAQLPQVDPSLLAAPDAKIYPETLPNGAQVSFVVSKRRNQAAFVGTDLPSPGAGNVYHLWTLKGTTVVRPDNTLTGGSESTQAFSGPIDDSTALAVNIEPAGTNPQAPTTTVLGSAEI